jgi:hypothetical protein
VAYGIVFFGLEVFPIRTGYEMQMSIVLLRQGRGGEGMIITVTKL